MYPDGFVAASEPRWAQVFEAFPIGIPPRRHHPISGGIPGADKNPKTRPVIRPPGLSGRWRKADTGDRRGRRYPGLPHRGMREEWKSSTLPNLAWPELKLPANQKSHLAWERACALNTFPNPEGLSLRSG